MWKQKKFSSFVSPVNNSSSPSHSLFSDHLTIEHMDFILPHQWKTHFKAAFDLFTIVWASLLRSCQIFRLCRLVTQLAVSWGVTTVSSCVLACERVRCCKLLLMHVWLCDIVLLMRIHTPLKLLRRYSSTWNVKIVQSRTWMLVPKKTIFGVHISVYAVRFLSTWDCAWWGLVLSVVLPMMFALHTGVWCGVGWIRAGGCFWGLGLAPYFQSIVLNRRNAQADALLHLTVSPGARLCGGSSHLHSVAALHPWTTVCVWVHACAWTENSGKCSLFWRWRFSLHFFPSC